MFRNKYALTPIEAIRTVLDECERDTCATVKVANVDESFSIEYLNHPDDSECFYNVTTDALRDTPRPLEVDDKGAGFTIVETQAETVDVVHQQMYSLAEYASPHGKFIFQGAATKRVPASSWEPSLREAVVGLAKHINPFSDPPDV